MLLVALLALFMAQDEPAPPAPWQVRELKSEMDDRVTVVFSRDGDRAITSFAGRESRPVVHVRCSRGQSDVMVYTGIAAKSGPYDAGDVRLRFDTDSARSVIAKETDDHANLLMDNRWVLDQMLTAQKMLFQFTPVSARPQVVGFPLEGLLDALKPHASTCGVDLSEVGDPGVYVLLVDPVEEGEARRLASKLSDKLKAESVLLPWLPGLPRFYVAVGRFAKREDAVALVTLAREKKVPSWEKIKVGKMNSKATRLIDEPFAF